MKRVVTQRLRRLGRWTAGGVFAAAVTLAVTPVSSAQAADLGGFLKNHKTGKCLAANGAGNLYVWPCQAGNLEEVWLISPRDNNGNPYKTASDGYGRYRLINRASGQCLVMAWGTNNQGFAKTGSCTERPETAVIDGVGDGWDAVQLRGWHNFTSNKQICVAANTSVYPQECNDKNGYQRWRLN
ncbi:hypothetical protein ACFWIB_19580 [Streptomyces sp. NPDC127051]|uniref:hypothetical protein n=1 Tax=Streptomyces sp. NPDC127051 TaxID=3347119 RepID=UPI003648C90F